MYKIFLLAFMVIFPSVTNAGDPPFKRTSDVIYMKKDGFALTYDAFLPEKQNGAAVVMMVSGGWFSNHASLITLKDELPDLFRETSAALLKDGFSVFFVVHGSQPRFTIPEIVDQTATAIREIRKKSAEYGIDGKKMGIYGGSAGGHLSLMHGVKGKEHIQAVVAYFPPTDFLNYGGEGIYFDDVVRGLFGGKNPFISALDLRELDSNDMRINLVTDKERFMAHLKKISPITSVSKNTAPVLFIHGDKDKLVPLQQSEKMSKKLTEAGVENKVIVKKGGDHGWKVTQDEVEAVKKWFSTHLK